MQAPMSWSITRRRFSTQRRKELEQRRQNHPTNEITLLALLRAYDADGDETKALSVCRALVTIYQGQNHPLKALAIMRRMIDLDPKNVALLGRLAETFESLHRHHEARQTYLDAAQLARAQHRTDIATTLLKRAHQQNAYLGRPESQITEPPTLPSSDSTRPTDVSAEWTLDMFDTGHHAFEGSDTYESPNDDMETTLHREEDMDTSTNRLSSPNSNSPWAFDWTTVDLRPPRTWRESSSMDTEKSLSRSDSNETEPVQYSAESADPPSPLPGIYPR